MFNHIPLEGEVKKLTQLNENGTRYYVTPEGNKYPSVTTVLAEHGRAGILNWRRSVGEDEANRISKQASTRGTKFHKAVEQYLNNEPHTLTTPLEVETFNAFKPILANINNIRAQELRMYSDHLRIAGTVDCIAEYEGKLSVIDFKTSSGLKKKEYIQSYFMQCAAYAVMLEEQYNLPVNRIVVLISVEGEAPQIFVEKRDNFISDLLYYRDLYEAKNPVLSDSSGSINS